MPALFWYGISIASIGAASLAASVILEIIKKEPIYLIMAKAAAGVLGVGGILLGISALA